MTEAPKILVVTPTYNEKETIGPLVKKIFELKIPNLKMAVVDDNSPDGTGALAENLSQTYPLRVMHNPEKIGLGRAYAGAFRKILNPPAGGEKPDYIIQLDADLSHDPAVIPKMLDKMGSCDLVLGSRYIPGGRIENWDFFRKLISYFGNLYARLMLKVPIRDLTTGFKCYRREVLENIDLDALSSIGYNFQIETTSRAWKKGYKICEIPIVFTERKTGASKFNLPIIIEAFFKVLWRRFHE